MLVILMNDQLIQPNVICKGCLMANQEGKPRWHGGELLCGRALQWRPEDGGDTCAAQMTRHPNQYECQMGFRIANID